MSRWVKVFPATVLWAFVVAGTVGLVEGVSQWLRFDVIAGHDPGVGLVRLLSPYVALYGWCGAVVAALVYVPIALITATSRRPRHWAFVLTLGVVLGALAFVYAGYVFREHLLPDWWLEHGEGAGALLLSAVWAGTVLVVWKPMGRLAEALTNSPGRGAFLAVTVFIVATALWPDWREEGRHARTGYLGPQSEAPAGAPNVLLLTIDTWRRDALSRHDPAAPPTPALDRFAAESLDYGQAWTGSCWTLPGVAAMMTGMPPRALGVEQYRPLPVDRDMLAEAAWRAGYSTAAILGNPYLTPGYGFDRGFEFYDHSLELEVLHPASRAVLAREAAYYLDVKFEPEDASVLIPKALRWLRRRPAERPFLLWVHLMNPHLPYVWRELPAFAAEGDGLPGTPPDPADLPDHPWFAGDRFRARRSLAEALPDVPDSVRAGVRTLYAREVQYTDAWVGHLLASMRADGLMDSTLVVITADHGEEFFEHGGYEHGHSMMPEVSRVPLLVRRPDGGEGAVVDRPVSSLDLMPTLCAELGWTAPPDLPGRDDLWTASDDAPEADAPRTLVLENTLYGGPDTALLRWPWYRVEGDESPQALWFDLAADDGARHPLAAPPDAAAAIEAEAARLRLEWDAVAGSVVAGDAEGPTESVRRKLRSLGY